jgi:hypothetical protein
MYFSSWHGKSSIDAGCSKNAKSKANVPFHGPLFRQLIKPAAPPAYHVVDIVVTADDRKISPGQSSELKEAGKHGLPSELSAENLAAAALFLVNSDVDNI